MVAVLVLLASSTAPVTTAEFVAGGRSKTQTVSLAPGEEAELDAGADVSPRQLDVAPFQLLGVSWSGDTEGGQVRVRSAEGWDEWVELERATPGSGEDTTAVRSASRSGWARPRPVRPPSPTGRRGAPTRPRPARRSWPA